MLMSEINMSNSFQLKLLIKKAVFYKKLLFFSDICTKLSYNKAM